MCCSWNPVLIWKDVVQGAEQGHLADTLSRMLGVYVGLKGELMPENIKKWNVLKVRRLHRLV